MASEVERQLYFDKQGQMRIAVRIETLGTTYVRNLSYPDTVTAEEVEGDIEELLALDSFCWLLQGELGRPPHNQIEHWHGFACRPLDRRVILQEKRLVGTNLNDRSRIRLSLVDELADESEPSFNGQLQREERLIGACPLGLEYVQGREYVERTRAALPRYLAEHRALVCSHAERLADKRELWRTIRLGRNPRG